MAKHTFFLWSVEPSKNFSAYPLPLHIDNYMLKVKFSFQYLNSCHVVFTFSMYIIFHMFTWCITQLPRTKFLFYFFRSLNLTPRIIIHILIKLIFFFLKLNWSLEFSKIHNHVFDPNCAQICNKSLLSLSKTI